MYTPHGSVLTHQVAGVDGPVISLGMYRPDLVAALAAGLPGGVLHTGHRRIAFSQEDRSAVVTFDNGVSVEADGVIAANGIHSTLQRYVVKPRRPVFSGVVAYRGVMPAARVPDWSWPQALVNWVSQGKHFLVFPVRAGTLLNYVGFLPADEQMRESWSAPSDPAVLSAAFSAALANRYHFPVGPVRPRSATALDERPVGPARRRRTRDAAAHGPRC
jgi:salicylate hydroxylase